MTIGIVTPYYPDTHTTNSGIANHFSMLATSLTAVGNKVVVIHIRHCYEHEMDGVTKTEFEEITLLTCKVSLAQWLYKKVKHKWALLDFLLKLKCMLVAYKNIDRLNKKYNIELIETTSYFSLCYLYSFKKQTLPVVVRVSTTFLQMMDTYYPFKSRLLRFFGVIEIWMIKKSRFLITHARDHAREIEKLYHINADKFHIIPHGVSLPVHIATALPESDHQLRVLYVGRFEYRKGTDVLLKAIPLVLETCPGVRFELIGTDPDNEYENSFRSRQTPDISKCVIFRGNADNDMTNKAYAGCDIFVAPSRYESFGLIYIEAMSYGKPVIGCNVGGVSEIIENNQNGLFAEPGDHVDLANKINFIIGNRQMRKKMGMNALKTAESKFTKEKLAENSLCYYKKAIQTFHSA